MSRSPFRPVRRWPRYRGRWFWPIALVLAACAALTTGSVVQRAQVDAAAFGTLREVPVATRDLDVGSTIDDGDIAWRSLPVAVIGDDAFEGDPTGATVVSRIVEGEVLMSSRVGRDGGHGPLALVAPDARALVVPVAEVVPSITVGARVDLLAGDRWVARDGVVVETTEQTVTVAVDEDDAPDVSVAILEGTVALALVSSG